MVSIPTYDPNLLSKPNKAAVNAASKKLETDKDQPLLNRAIERTYPPGSTFKVVTLPRFWRATTPSARRPRWTLRRCSTCPTPPPTCPTSAARRAAPDA